MMYPFDKGPFFVEDAWYIAAWSSEVTATPRAVTVLGNRIALFRTAAGAPVAFADRCPHRGFPLSKGQVVGDVLQCGYHGFTFEATGRCCRIPSQEHIPRGTVVRRYPLVERWQWIWIWTGDPDAADEALIPRDRDLGFDGGPWVAAIGGDFAVRARYQLFNENLLDLTHLTFLHPGTIGTPGIAETAMTTAVSGRIVRVQRDTLGEQTTPFYATRLGIPIGRIDRRHVTSFVAPSFHIIHVITTKAGDSTVVHGEHKILHAITPETPTTLRDFWAITRTYNTAPEMTDFLRESINGVIRQDIAALEATELLIDDGQPIVDLNCAADEAALKGRRVVQGLLRAQARVAGMLGKRTLKASGN